MAFAESVVQDLSHSPRATTDFQTHQYKPVMLDPAGVVFASTDIGSLTASAIYVLGNKPDSGEACQLVNAPNVTKALCTGSAFIGCAVVVQASGAGFTAGSFGTGGSGTLRPPVGVALEAANSGDLFAVHLRP